MIKSFSILTGVTRSENLPLGQTESDALGFQRYQASQAQLQAVHFLWRPFLPGPNVDMILELAFAAGCRYIVTLNVKDFHGLEQLGVTAITPRDFLHLKEANHEYANHRTTGFP